MTAFNIRSEPVKRVKVGEESFVKKLTCAVLFGVGVLSGCASQSPREIPVVESGTSLSPGPLRDVGSSPVVASQQEASPTVTVMTPPEAGLPAITAADYPTMPIQAGPEAAPVFELPAEGVVEAAPVVAAVASGIDAPVQALLGTAQQQRARGDLNGAASSLERALRIAPQEPQVLYRLSEIRLMQGDAAQAEQLAQRGLSYSSGRPALQAGLWDLIAEAREKQGDGQGASEAREKAKAFM